jgi:hypothetical protein
MKQNLKEKKPVRYYIRIALILCMVFVLGVFLAITVYVNTRPAIIAYREINTSVFIANNTAAFNTDTDALDFGKNYPGGYAIRYFNISSKERATVMIYIAGDIAQFITFSDNEILLEPEIIKQVSVYLAVPEDAQGNYTGRISVYFYKR